MSPRWVLVRVGVAVVLGAFGLVGAQSCAFANDIVVVGPGEVTGGMTLSGSDDLIHVLPGGRVQPAAGQDGVTFSFGGAPAGINTVINQGTIGAGSGVAIRGGASALSVTNLGTIDGSVVLGAGGGVVSLATGSALSGALSAPSGASAELVLSGQGVGSLTGPVTGFARLQKLDDGAWRLAAPVPVNGVDLEAGTLTLVPGGAFTGTPMIVAAPGTTFDAGGQLVTLAGIIGELTLQRSDGVSFSDGAPAPSLLVIERGALRVAGLLNSAEVRVGVDGLLGGNGTVAAPVNVLAGGTVGPGASIGTLTVNGNLSFAPGSSLQVDISPLGAADRLVVNGNVTINGATVVVVPEAQSNSYPRRTVYRVLDATGIVGDFAAAVVSPALAPQFPGLQLSISRSGEALDLIVLNSDFARLVASAPAANLAAVAAVLDAARSDLLAASPLARHGDAIATLSPAAAAERLARLLPSLTSASRQSAMGVLPMVWRANRVPLQPAEGQSPHAQTVASAGFRTATDAALPSTRMALSPNERLGLTTFGSLQRRDVAPGEGRASTGTGGLSLAARLDPAEWAQVWLTVGYAHSETRINTLVGRSEADLYFLGVDARIPVDAFVLTGTVAGGVGRIEQRRTDDITASRLSGDLDQATAFAELRLHYPRALFGGTLTPSAGVQLAAGRFSSMRETGGPAALSITRSASSDVFLDLGIGWRGSIGHSSATTIDVAVGLTQRVGGDDDPLRAEFANATGSTAFLHHGAEASQTTARSAIALGRRLVRGVHAQVTIDGEYGTSHTAAQLVGRLSVGF